MSYYRRRTLEAWEEAAALAAGAAVGLGAAYLVRIWLRRAPTDRRERARGGRPAETRVASGSPPQPTEGGAGRER